MKNPIKRAGFKCVKRFKKGEAVVGIITFKDDVFIATNNALYRGVNPQRLMFTSRQEKAK